MRPRDKVVEEAEIAMARMGAGSWAILTILISLLAITCFVVYFGWTLGNGVDVPISGYVAMALGVVFSLAVGIGLMALIFYSSRKGYDEPPRLIAPEDGADESAQNLRADRN